MLRNRAFWTRWTMLAAGLLAGMALSPRIELITMGQGEHLFERFGHAAICVMEDDSPQRSRCYNYGTTDFDSPPQQLGWAFLRGTARFWVSVAPPAAMLRAYAAADRDVYRQRLPLEPEQVRRVVLRLEHEAREENRYYVYHHFHDNCSTRLRDILDLATEGSLSRSSHLLPVTHRDLGRRGLADETWLLLASDLLLGRGADRPLSEYEAMFLPRVLRQAVAREIGAVPERVHARTGPPFPEIGPSGRGRLALAALLPVALGAAAHARRGPWARRLSIHGLRALGALLGLLAIGLWSVAALSQVRELRLNEALLVFVPMDAAIPLMSDRALAIYARVRVIGLCAVLVLLALGVLLQPLHAPLMLPLAVFAALATRSVTRRCSNEPRREPATPGDGARPCLPAAPIDKLESGR